MKRAGTVMLMVGWSALTLGTSSALAEDQGADESKIEQAQAAEPVIPAEPGTPVETESAARPAAPTTAQQTNIVVTQAPQQPSLLSRIGIGLMLGGGVTDFTNSGARADTSVGGFWDVRAVFGGRAPLGLEVAYVGAAHSLHGAGVGGDAALVRNGVEGTLRLNLVLSPLRQIVIPFAFGGLGWTHQSLVDLNGSIVSGLKNGDDGMTVPVGGGLALNYKGAYLDGRFTYRPTFFNGGDDRLDTWSAGANIGYLF